MQQNNKHVRVISGVDETHGNNYVIAKERKIITLQTVFLTKQIHHYFDIQLRIVNGYSALFDGVLVACHYLKQDI